MSTVDTGLVKKPHQTERYTQGQVDELRLCINDPIHFVNNYTYIQHPLKGRLQFSLYDFQKDLIERYHNYKYSITMMARQTGKSTTAAAYLLWYAMFKPDSTILVASNKYANAQEIMTKLRFAYETCPNFLRAGCIAYNKGSIEFDNGSRILAQATTDNTGRGMSLSLVYLDEFAFVPPRIAQEFWTSISPTLSTGGSCIITSTPNQDDDQFARIWKEATNTQDEFGNKTDTGVNGFKSYLVKWEEHPERNEEWAKKEEAKIGEERFRREHNCEFIVWDETLIKPLKLLDLGGIEPLSRQGQIRFFKHIDKEKKYFMALDPAMGTGGDNAAIVLYSAPRLEQVAEWQHNKSNIKEQLLVMKTMLDHLIEQGVDANNIYWSVENNTLGEAVIQLINEMGEDMFQGVFVHEAGKKRKGFTTTHKSKLQVCSKFKLFVENNKILMYSKNLIREVKNFIAKGGSYEAKAGETDDLVLATLLAIRLLEQVGIYEEDIYSDMIDSLDEDESIKPMPIAILT